MVAGRPPGRPKSATPRHLEQVALFYLQRYSSSAANLRRVLMRRVRRSADVHGSDIEEGRAAVESLIGRMTAAGLLDDVRYADATARALARRGRSTRGIRATLAHKGVSGEIAAAALERLQDEEADLDLKAAVAYARRRGLGPFRTEDHRSERRLRDLAAMTRAGYPVEIARKVVDAPDRETLLDEIPELL